MSFSSDVKQELCRAQLSRKCCAQAEAYGILLYCNTFSSGEIRIITESEALAQRLPALFKKHSRSPLTVSPTVRANIFSSSPIPKS